MAQLKARFFTRPVKVNAVFFYPQVTVSRITCSSSSQVRHTDPAETLHPGPDLYGKQRQKQDSTLSQHLSQMSVSCQAGLATR